MSDSSGHLQTGTAEAMMPGSTRVREILEIEAAAIARAAERLDKDQVELALDLLQSCAGKVVLTGVGKSGVIAQKIAQTLASTGTIALFIHPSDAVHGGLGIVSGDDVVVALSNSGETDELLAILPALDQRGVKIISVAGNLDSTLAKHADAVIDASVDKEACPLNLAPTCSTTVALALGDALAMTLMSRRGLSTEDFALNHPAGRLGKRLTIRVADLMHPGPNVSPDAGWLDVVHALSEHALGGVNITDADGLLLGIVTEGDLRRSFEHTRQEQFHTLTAGMMMTKDPVVATPELLAYDAMKLMEDRPRQISVLPVVDADGRSVGLLRIHDIVRSGL